MAKAKSSASSATRKKHEKKAAKAAANGDEEPPLPQQPAQRGQKKQKKDRFAPKVKTYTPPPPPPKGAPDPVDLYLQGGSAVDAELVVVLRKLGKRDESTIGKGVEALEEWVKAVLDEERKASKSDEQDDEGWKLELRRDQLVESMNVWAHHLPRLLLHPSRRLRLAAHTLHTLLTSRQPAPDSPRHSPLLAATRSALLLPQWIENSEYVASWAMGPFDGDRQVRMAANRSWASVVQTGNIQEDTEAEAGIDLAEQAQPIFGFAFHHILAPPVSTSRDAEGGAAETEAEADAAALKTQSLLLLASLLSSLPSPLPLEQDTIALFSSAELWDLADPQEQPSAALRRALYQLLGAASERKEETLLEAEGSVEMVAARVLKSCWGEDEGWAGIIAFLRRYPQAWTLADSALSAADKDAGDEDGSDDEDSDDDDDDDDESAPVASTSAPAPPSSTFAPSPVLSLLFLHLQTACTNQPASYPTVLLLLTTIPTSILPPRTDALSLLFENFWSALSGRSLSSGTPGPMGGKAASPTEEWATALLECLVWESGAMSKEGVEQTEVEALMREWVGRMWSAFLGIEEGGKPSKSVATPKVAQQIEATLAKLATRDSALFETSWQPISASTSDLLGSTTAEEKLAYSLLPLAVGLQAFASSSHEVVGVQGRDLAVQSVKTAATEIVQAQTDGARTAALLKFTMSVREAVAEEAAVLEALDDLSNFRLPVLLATPYTSTLALSFLQTYLPSTSPASRAAIWLSLFSPSTPPASVLLRLVNAVGEGAISTDDLPSAGLEGWTLEVAGRVLGDELEFEEVEVEILQRLMVQPQPFIPPTLPSTLLSMLAVRLPPLATAAIAASTPSDRVLHCLAAPARLLSHYLQVGSNAQDVLALSSATYSPPSTEVLNGASLPLALFEIGYVLPNCRLEDVGAELPHEAIFPAQEAWGRLVAVGGEKLLHVALERLGAGVTSVDVRASPIELVSIAADLLSPFPSIPLSSILPSSSTFDSLRSTLTIQPPAASLSILSPLVPLSTEDSPATYATEVDIAALPPYARALLALLEVSARADHAWIRSSDNLWVLSHILLLADIARDELASAGSTRGFFGRGITEDVLTRLVGAADGLASYLISSVANSLPEGWHADALKVVRAKEPAPTGGDGMVQVLDALARRGRSQEDVYSRRAFSTLLGALLRYAEGVQDAERWFAWAQSLTEASDLACAVILAVKPVLFESPRFERYQNEIASLVAGVPSSTASTKGLPLLRLLLATTPPLDAPIIFLPQQRTMFLIQAVQRWIASDDDLDEEILSSVAELFLHLAPIVQELSGSHWELVFDVVESNLEIASWDEPVTLPALYHSCRLLSLVKELASANSELKATARARIDKSLELVRDLFVSRPDSRARNRPRVVILEIMAKLIRDLPPKLLAMGDSFDQLLHLLRDPSLAVQQSSYDLVVRIAEKHVSDLVVEVELQTDARPTIALPQELIELLSAKLSTDVLSSPEQYAAASTYLLAWLVAFRFFETASPRIKSAYTDQLRRADLIGGSFLPSVFAILNLSDRTRVVDITPWAVNEFHLELVDDLSATILPVFATFIYYRALQALPSLIREWWERCKNRQLSMAVSNFTSRHFSPVLIAAELAHLRDPNDPAGKQLRDNDDFTVKVAAGANEVKAVFVVDEESMEIGVRLPAEFPLAQVEVKDVRKVGVTDKQWRAWLLAVQQVITTQNGLIADALNIFKSNAVAHFEGVEPCAICYSSISVVDRSLANKTCKVCSNAFHASCVYTWFQKSGGATCPLCRSLWSS